MVSNIEYEVDVRDAEYQRQAGKAWLARVVAIVSMAEVQEFSKPRSEVDWPKPLR